MKVSGLGSTTFEFKARRAATARQWFGSPGLAGYKSSAQPMPISISQAQPAMAETMATRYASLVTRERMCLTWRRRWLRQRTSSAETEIFQSPVGAAPLQHNGRLTSSPFLKEASYSVAEVSRRHPHYCLRFYSKATIVFCVIL